MNRWPHRNRSVMTRRPEEGEKIIHVANNPRWWYTLQLRNVVRQRLLLVDGLQSEHQELYDQHALHTVNGVLSWLVVSKTVIPAELSIHDEAVHKMLELLLQTLQRRFNGYYNHQNLESKVVTEQKSHSVKTHVRQSWLGFILGKSKKWLLTWRKFRKYWTAISTKE